MRKYLAALMLLVPSLSFGQGVRYILDQSSQVRPGFMTVSNSAVIFGNLPNWVTTTNPASAASSLGQTLSAPAYLRTSSRDGSTNNSPDNGGIVSAISFDGINWEATRNYTIFPVFSRDASTIWHSNTTTTNWVSIYTDAFNSTNKTFGIATSTNLLSWQTNFSVTLTGTNTAGTGNNVWAPEWFVDGTNYYALVRLSTTANNNYGAPGVGWMRALNPGTWTSWSEWTPFDSTVRVDANDFYIVKKGSLYWLFSHGGTHMSGKQPAGSNVINNITLQYSTTPFGNYSPLVEITEPLRPIIRPGNGSAFFEGPSVVNVEGSRWRLFFQDGLDNTAWAIDSYDDFATWNTNSLRRLQYSGFDGPGHGTVVGINPTNQKGVRQAVLALGTGPTIGGAWLTNTNVINFRTAIGLGAGDGVMFDSVEVDSHDNSQATNFSQLSIRSVANSYGGFYATYDGAYKFAFAAGSSNNLNDVIMFRVNSVDFVQPIKFVGTTAATTRTNLGLGATWLTNTSVTNFRSAIELGSAATNDGSAFQPASSSLTNLASNNGSGLTNIPISGVVNLQTNLNAKLGTNGSAAGLTNFPTLNQNTTGTATNVTGVVALANGGTGATNATNARSNLSLGTAATNDASAFQPASANLTNLASNNAINLTNLPALLLRTNGSAAGLTNFPTLDQNTTGTATNVTGVVAVVNGGTGGTNTALFQTALFNSSSLNAQNQRITNLAAPVNDSDAATRAYVFGLFSRVAPSVSFGNTVGNVQIGSTVTTVPLSWSISPTNTPVVFQSLTPVGSISTSLRATNITGTFTNDTNWTLVVIDGTGLPGATVTNSTSIAFRHYMSWGIASTTTLDNSQIQNLHTNTAAGAGREFRTGKGKSVSISGNGQYIYFAYPANFGAASFIVNGSPNTAWISNTVTYTNSSGNTSQFLIYRSIDLMFGTSIPITLN